MPIRDLEKRRAWYRQYRALRRSGDTSSTPAKPRLEESFRLSTISGIVATLESETLRLVSDDELPPINRAKAVAALCAVSLKALEVGEIAARLEALESSIKNRENDE